MANRISVCIPTYRNDKTISETLQSVWKQEYEDYEIVIREDREGKGLANNLNEIVKLAKGEILLFLAGDDILLPGALEAISNEFKDDQMGMVLRPYYWFKDRWDIPVRKTKQKGYQLDDLVFLCGQMSGIAIRKKALENEFQELRFVEFASGVLPTMKKWDFKVLSNPTVAIRINSSDSQSDKCYNQSPSLNWQKVCQDSFSDNKPFIGHMEFCIGKNFIGLLQIRMYGGWIKAMKEVGIMLKLNTLILYYPQFWFYLGLIQLPSWLLKRLRNFCLFTLNRRLCK